MCESDDDVGTLLADEWIRARKEHVCYACHEQIRKGDRYHRIAGIYEGWVESFKHCARCWTIVKRLWAEGAEYVDYALACGESWEENYGELPEELARLAFITPDEAQALIP